MEIIRENVIDRLYVRLIDDCPTSGHFYSVEVGTIIDQTIAWWPAEEKVQLEGNRYTTDLNTAWKRYHETKKKLLNYERK